MLAGHDFNLGGDDVFVLGDGACGAYLDCADDADGAALVYADNGEAGLRGVSAMLLRLGGGGVDGVDGDGVSEHRLGFIDHVEREIDDRIVDVQMDFGVSAVELEAGSGGGKRIERAEAVTGFGVHVEIDGSELDQFGCVLKGVEDKDAVLIG